MAKRNRIDAQKLEERLEFLESAKEPHFAATVSIHQKALLKPIHYFSLAVLNRSLSLIYGFVSLVRGNNYICAAPLVRVQIDNLLRFRAAFLTSDVDKFVEEFTRGKHIRHIEDSTGNKMTDAYLRSTLSKQYTWLNELYERASGYVHLSNTHILHMMSIEPIDDDTAKASFYVGADEKFVSSEDYLEVTESMIRVTYFLLESIQDLVL